MHPESRYVFPGGDTALFLDDFKYAVGTSDHARGEARLDTGPGHASDVRTRRVQLRHRSQDDRAQGADPDRIDRDPGWHADLLPDRRRRAHTVRDATVDLHYQQYGAYAEASHSFTDNLRLIAGVRVDVNSRFDEIPISPRGALIFNALQDG